MRFCLLVLVLVLALPSRGYGCPGHSEEQLLERACRSARVRAVRACRAQVAPGVERRERALRCRQHSRAAARICARRAVTWCSASLSVV